MRWFEGGLGPLSTALSSRGEPFSDEGCHGLGIPNSVFGLSRARGPIHGEGKRYSEASACCRLPRLLLTGGPSPAKAGALACAPMVWSPPWGEMVLAWRVACGATTSRPAWVGPGLQATRAPPPDFLLRSGAEPPPVVPWPRGVAEGIRSLYARRRRGCEKTHGPPRVWLRCRKDTQNSA